MSTFMLTLEGHAIEEFFNEPVNNLLMNMSSGLLPEHLSESDCQLLKEKFGTDWFTELGYDDVNYKRPKF